MKHSWKSILTCCLAAALLLPFAGCDSSGAGQSASPDDASDGQTATGGEGGSTTVVEMYTKEYPFEELMEEADLVVRGTVKGADLLTISGTGGGEMLSTEYQVEVADVLRGQAPSGQEVAVRCLGDASADSVVYEGVPVLEKDREYLLFLDDGAGHSGTFNTEDDYYYLVGNDQGAYEKEEQAVLTVAGKEEPAYVRLSAVRESGKTGAQIAQAQAQGDGDLGEALTAGQLQADLAAVNQESPPNPQQDKEEAAQTYQNNLENGIISQEQYDQYMDQLENPTYGEVTQRETLW